MIENKGYIYKITSPTNRIYIGQTKSSNLEKRFKRYSHPKGCLNQPKIKRSIDKYGWNNHKFEIIHIIDKYNKEEINKLEIFYIKVYDSCDNGLNCTLGGEGRSGNYNRKGVKPSDKALLNMRGASPYRIEVIDLETGLFYDSINDVARCFNMWVGSLHRYMSRPDYRFKKLIN